MSKLAGMISLKGGESKEYLKTMLSFSSTLVPGEEVASSIYSFENFSFGHIGSVFASNKNKTIHCVFVGSLTRKEKLLHAMRKDKKSYFENDAELIISAFEILNISFFSHLEGDFTCILFDEAKKELYVARDKMGSHDLYWCSNQHALFFASSLKALLSTGLISATPCNEALATYLALGYISQDKSPIEGINRLLPGYYLKANLNGNLSISSYWSFSSAFERRKQISFASSEELFSELKNYILRAVTCRVDPTIACGAVSAGSIGSSVTHEILFQTLQQPIPMLSLHYGRKSENLPEFVREKEEVKITINEEHFLQNLVPMIWSMETPTADYDHLTSFEFAKWCNALNLTPYFDTGFTQAFFDYSSPVIKHVLEESHKPSPLALLLHTFNKKISGLYSHLFPRLALKSLRRTQTRDPRIGFIERQGPLSHKELLEASPSLGKLFQGDLFFHEFYHLPRIESEAASLFYLTMKTEVIDKIHTIRCKFSTDHNRAAASPFLDLELLEFLASLEDAIWASPDMLASFPSSLVQEEYQTVPSFTHADFHTLLSEPRIAQILHSLKNGFLVESGFISGSFIDKILRKKRASDSFILYQILLLELWMRLFIDLPLSQNNAFLSIDELLLPS